MKTTTPTKLLFNALFSSSQADGDVHHHLPEDREKIVSGSHHSTSCSATHGPVGPRAQHEDSYGSSPIGHNPVCRDDRKPHLQAHSLGSDKLTKDCPTAGEAHVRWMSCGVDGGRRIDCPEQHGWCRGKCTWSGRGSLWWSLQTERVEECEEANVRAIWAGKLTLLRKGMDLVFSGI